MTTKQTPEIKEEYDPTNPEHQALRKDGACLQRLKNMLEGYQEADEEGKFWLVCAIYDMHKQTSLLESTSVRQQYLSEIIEGIPPSKPKDCN